MICAPGRFKLCYPCWWWITCVEVTAAELMDSKTVGDDVGGTLDILTEAGAVSSEVVWEQGWPTASYGASRWLLRPFYRCINATLEGGSVMGKIGCVLRAPRSARFQSSKMGLSKKCIWERAEKWSREGEMEKKDGNQVDWLV